MTQIELLSILKECAISSILAIIVIKLASSEIISVMDLKNISFSESIEKVFAPTSKTRSSSILPLLYYA